MTNTVLTKAALRALEIKRAREKREKLIAQSLDVSRFCYMSLDKNERNDIFASLNIRQSMLTD